MLKVLALVRRIFRVFLPPHRCDRDIIVIPGILAGDYLAVLLFLNPFANLLGFSWEAKACLPVEGGVAFA